MRRCRFVRGTGGGRSTPTSGCCRTRGWPSASGPSINHGLGLIERLCARLEAGEFDDAAPPARIHGDLWGGNVLYDAAGAVLIDPAAHGGHRITDLAMLALFGTAYLERVLSAYAEASNRLPDGWRDLIPLHQVHPLLVHTILFGGGYGAQALGVARRFA